MPAIFVKPRAGGRVRMPERDFRPMRTEGEWVQRNDFYERLLIGGDVVICEPPSKDEVTAAAVEAAPEAPSTPDVES
jgi:hypothetical protein